MADKTTNEILDIKYPNGDMELDATMASTDETKEGSNETSSVVPPSNKSGTMSDESLQQQGSEVAGSSDAAQCRSWDFSNRKVMVQGITKFHDVKTVTKSVNKWMEDINAKKGSSEENKEPVAFDRIKKAPKGTWMVVTMKTEEMVQTFIDYVNNTPELCSKRGNKLFAKLATDDSESTSRNQRADKNRKRDDDGKDNGDASDQPSKRQRKMMDGEEVQNARRHITEEELKDKITPLWRLTSEEQLDIKMKEMIKKCAMKIIQEIKIKFRTLDKEKTREKVPIYPWILQKRGIDMKPIVSAPTPLRNKCEFTFGYRYLADEADSKSSDANEQAVLEKTEPRKVPAIGFMVTGWAGGVSFSHSLQNIPSEAGALVDIVNAFLETSPLEPYDSKTHKGFWRILTMRSSRRTRECMVIVQHSPASSGGHGDDDSYDRVKEFDTEKTRLMQILTEAELPAEQGESPLKITSIFFQEFAGLSNPTPDHPVQHAFGNAYLTESLGKCKFQISPGAFFQVNTEGAEILYQLAVDSVREVSETPEHTLLFDVCCGTGTIGLTCMKEGVVGQVVGVDISEPAIGNAKVNAGLNGADETTTRFVAARAEQVLGREIQKAKLEKKQQGPMTFVAVLDPARDGLHAEVVKSLRGNEQIGRLVYVSCNPTGSLIRDAALLCAPPTKRYTGKPFQIVSATPVDMFPLTNHCEMVMIFDRLVDDSVDAKL